MSDPQPVANTNPYAAYPAGTAGGMMAAPGYPVVPGASGAAMKRRGSIAVWLGLPMITFGIYSLVWYFKIHKELAGFNRRHPLNPAGSVLVMLFLGWTVVAPLISFHNTAKAVAEAQRAAGREVTCSPGVAVLLAFVFGLHVWYIQHELNLVIDGYGNVPPGTEVPVAAM